MPYHFKARRGVYCNRDKIIWSSSYSKILHAKELMSSDFSFMISSFMINKISDLLGSEFITNLNEKYQFKALFDEGFNPSRNNLNNHSSETDEYFVPLSTEAAIVDDYPEQYNETSEQPTCV
jgi:hypothetical protein